MPKDPDDLGYFSDPSLLILSSLADGPKHGYALIKDIAAFSGTKLEPGTLYGAISRLERRGWIEALPVEDRRHPYGITAQGIHVLREQLTTMHRIVSVGMHRLPATP